MKCSEIVGHTITNKLYFRAASVRLPSRCCTNCLVTCQAKTVRFLYDYSAASECRPCGCIAMPATTYLLATGLRLFNLVSLLYKIVKAAEPVNPYNNWTAVVISARKGRYGQPIGSVDKSQANCKWVITSTDTSCSDQRYRLRKSHQKGERYRHARHLLSSYFESSWFFQYSFDTRKSLLRMSCIVMWICFICHMKQQLILNKKAKPKWKSINECFRLFINYTPRKTKFWGGI